MSEFNRTIYALGVAGVFVSIAFYFLQKHSIAQHGILLSLGLLGIVAANSLLAVAHGVSSLNWTINQIIGGKGGSYTLADLKDIRRALGLRELTSEEWREEK